MRVPPVIIHFNVIFHYKPSILGTPIYGNPHIFRSMASSETGKMVHPLENPSPVSHEKKC